VLAAVRRAEVFREEPVFPLRGRLDFVRDLLGVVCVLANKAELCSLAPELVGLPLVVKLWERRDLGFIFKSDRKLVLGTRYSFLPTLMSVPMEEELELFREVELALPSPVLLRFLLATRLGFLVKLAVVAMLVSFRLGMVVKLGLLPTLGLVMRLELSAPDLTTSKVEFLLRVDFKVKLEVRFPLRAAEPWLELAVEKLKVAPLVDKRGLVRVLFWLEVAMLITRPAKNRFSLDHNTQTNTNKKAHRTLTS